VGKSRDLLIVIEKLRPLVKEYKCVEVNYVVETLEEHGLSYLTHAEIARAYRVWAGVELTACDERFVPCTLSGRKVFVYLHPERVKQQSKLPHKNWLSAMADAWRRKADRFEEQM